VIRGQGVSHSRSPPTLALVKKRPERDPPPPEDWPKGTVELDDRSFPDFVDMYPLSVVEFWASWCAPCKAMRPERHRKLAESYDVMSIPHLVFISYGTVVGNYHGMMNRRKLEGKVRAMAKRYALLTTR
jgi:thiol-disulfide isomerase/thioredoxin